MSLYRDEALVLRSYRLGEADRIVVLLTAERGKVRAVAKGARRTKSRLGARLEPLSRVRLLLWQGRDLDTVTQAETLEHYRRLREDLDLMTDAWCLAEAADQVCQDRQPYPQLYTMLTLALRTLEARPQRSALLVAGFYFKLLALEGVAPELNACVRCASREDLVAFDPLEGGVLCRLHRRGMGVSPEALGLMRSMLGGRLAPVLEEPDSPAAQAVSALATASLEAHLERRLRTPLLRQS